MPDKTARPILAPISRLILGLKALGPGVMLQSALYPYRKAYHSAKFGGVRGAQRARGSALRGLASLLRGTPQPEPDRPPIVLFPGRVLAHQWLASARGPERQRVELTCEHAVVRLAVLAPDLVRVRVSPTGRFPPPFSYAVAKHDQAWGGTDFTVEESAEYLTVRTAKLHCRIEKAHMAISFLDPDGTLISADAAGVGWQAMTASQPAEKVLCWKRMPPDEHVYGLGQKTTSLDKRGLSLRIWNTDPQHYGPGDDPVYSCTPFYLGLHEGRGYGIFFDNSGRGTFDFGAQTPGIARFESECGEMRYYFFYGPQLATVLDRYTELTGRMAMPPLWGLGYHQCRWSYEPEAKVRQVARQFRQRRIPCDALYLDIDYMDGFRCFTWHPERFPAPGQLIADLHQQGFKVVVMLDPGIKVDPGYWVCQEGLNEGVFCTYPDGKPFSGPVWPGECYFPDFTSPHARAWWGELYRGMVDLGVDGFWNDMNEPVVFGHQGDTFPDAVQHEWEGQGTDHRQAHNVYGMQMARATVEGVRRLRPAERPLVITRSLWAGTQRYNLHWLGDNYSDWPALRNAVQLVLNMGVSGMPFTGPDVGGYDGTPSEELLIRWNQLGTFMPFFRNHTAKWTGDQEPWAFGQRCSSISRHFIELRYHLLPYHYTAFWQSAQSGMPMMRPLFLAFQDDPHVPEIDDQFMFGDAFLVAPILESGATSRRVYIPQGKWYDFWEGTLTAGPQIASLHGPIDSMPLLVRAGSVVPGWPVMQYTAQRPVERLILHVYPGDGTSWLYEDDGHTWAFQEGQFRVTRLTCETSAQVGGAVLHVRRTAGGPFTPGYERIEVAIHGLTARPERVSVDGERVGEVEYEPATRTARFHTGLFDLIEATI